MIAELLACLGSKNPYTPRFHVELEVASGFGYLFLIVKEGPFTVWRFGLQFGSQVFRAPVNDDHILGTVVLLCQHPYPFIRWLDGGFYRGRGEDMLDRTELLGYRGNTRIDLPVSPVLIEKNPACPIDNGIVCHEALNICGRVGETFVSQAGGGSSIGPSKRLNGHDYRFAGADRLQILYRFVTNDRNLLVGQIGVAIRGSIPPAVDVASARAFRSMTGVCGIFLTFLICRKVVTASVST